MTSAAARLLFTSGRIHDDPFTPLGDLLRLRIDFRGGAPAAYASESVHPRAKALATSEGTVTVYFRGEATDQGTAAADDGVITWTVDGTTYTSNHIDCTDLPCPTRVTALVAKSPDNPDTVSLIR